MSGTWKSAGRGISRGMTRADSMALAQAALERKEKKAVKRTDDVHSAHPSGFTHLV